MAWTCQNCQTEIDNDSFEICWHCNAEKYSSSNSVHSISPYPQVTFKVFRGTFSTWNELFTDASSFASSLTPEQLINISHSVNDSDGVVTVW